MTFTAIIQTVPLTHGTARNKFYKSARILCDVEVSSTPMQLYYSDDNWSTSTLAGTIDAMNNPPEILTSLGSSRRRAWGIQNNSVGGNTIDALEIVYEVGPN